MMSKVKDIDFVLNEIKDGSVLMIGGFLGAGTPHKIVDKLVERNVKDLTIIANDTSFVDYGIGKLIANKQVKRVIASHIGTNKETGNQMNTGFIEVELVPQGTLAERIRAKGAGLGAIVTPTGIGTIVEENKQKLTIDGKEYLVEEAIGADYALIFGSIVDKSGNIFYAKSTKNFNPLMATAANKVIVEAKKIVEVGELDPDVVMTSGIFVDSIVGGSNG
ncbi:CoA transferase subunit A [Oceanivirga salmonicida]|uniref:CoA transferase subunit A n=1 Tax=Oceanivirga salmonicida TaxID=1769291 RepID=UPI0022AF3B14|nr:3-oxoacid CoA-transferase subunit A [Oceanivirga salmonicida]